MVDPLSSALRLVCVADGGGLLVDVGDSAGVPLAGQWWWGRTGEGGRGLLTVPMSQWSLSPVERCGGCGENEADGCRCPFPAWIWPAGPPSLPTKRSVLGLKEVPSTSHWSVASISCHGGCGGVLDARAATSMVVVALLVGRVRGSGVGWSLWPFGRRGGRCFGER